MDKLSNLEGMPAPQLAAGGPHELLYVRFASALMFEGASAGDLANFTAGDLFDELMAEFPSITRQDVFLGLSIAWSLIKADMLANLRHTQQLQRRLNHRVAA
jgi:hypothetical protein